MGLAVFKNQLTCLFEAMRIAMRLWHIIKKLPEKLGGYEEYEYIKTTLAKQFIIR
jgi:hypothetical protein